MKQLTRIAILESLSQWFRLLDATSHGGYFNVQPKTVSIMIAEDGDKPNAEEPLFYDCINIDPETYNEDEAWTDFNTFCEKVNDLIQEQNPNYK